LGVETGSLIDCFCIHPIKEGSMHRRIDGGSPDPAFAGPMLIRQLLVRDSPRWWVVDGDCRLRSGRDLALDQPALGTQGAASAPISASMLLVKAADVVTSMFIRWRHGSNLPLSWVETGVLPAPSWPGPMALIFSIGRKSALLARLWIPAGERVTANMLMLSLRILEFVKTRNRTAR
jgi:hypothetical protein